MSQDISPRDPFSAAITSVTGCWANAIDEHRMEDNNLVFLKIEPSTPRAKPQPWSRKSSSHSWYFKVSGENGFHPTWYHCHNHLWGHRIRRIARSHLNLCLLSQGPTTKAFKDNWLFTLYQVIVKCLNYHFLIHKLWWWEQEGAYLTCTQSWPFCNLLMYLSEGRSPHSSTPGLDAGVVSRDATAQGLPLGPDSRGLLLLL